MDFEKINKIFISQQNRKFVQKNTTAEYRIQKLKQFKKNLVEHKNEINQALKADFKKSEVETVLTELIPVISMVNQNIKSLKKWMKPKTVKGGVLFLGTRKYISYEAKGNCLVISPWNYPFQLAIYPVLTAFSAGNTVILKPSEFTPNTNIIIKKLIRSTFSFEEITIVEGGVEISTFLLDKPFDHIFFTGSTEVGRVVMEKASKHLSSVGLELGGKSPVVIDSGFDIEKAAKNIIWGKLVNSAQTCVAPDYVLLEKNISKRFVKEVSKFISELYPSIENNSDYCAIINAKNLERLKFLLEDAREKGAKIIVGGKTFSNGKMEPTIVTNVNSNMKIMQEEIFGPILPIMEINSIQEVKDYINLNDNPLVTYVYSYDQKFIEEVRSSTNSGGFCVNESLLHVASPNLPFGGAGKSGIGRYHGKYGFEEMSNIRSVLHRKYDVGLAYFYPPYSKSMERLIHFIVEKFNRFL